MASIKPLHDRVVVERVEAEEKTASGIVLPGSAAEKPDMGVVVAVGEGKLLDNGNRHALCVKVGNKVLFGKYSGQVVKLDGKELLVMREDDILAIVE
ncbi:MAG: co-chaperone GroES [Neisseriaceae bacterium]|nr:MAG: co-chaperone GroES [Neisseriaceae bacterium]